MNALEKKALAAIEKKAGKLKDLSRKLYRNPEVMFKEHKACAWLCGELKGLGYRVKKGTGLPTAFRADLKSGSPCVAVLAEYDALRGIGHGCAHNLIAAAAIGAACGLAAVKGELPGNVAVIGCPAEEGGGGKIHLLKSGVFKGVGAAMMVHPSSNETVVDKGFIACQGLDITFLGKSAHASGAPEKGRNALNALIETFNALNALRQHLPQDVRMHWIVTEGGTASNIVPERASGEFTVRSSDDNFMPVLLKKVKECARAAAKMMGCKVKFRVNDYIYCSMRPNRPLAELVRDSFRDVGVKAKFWDGKGGRGSSDIGNVSQKLPALHPSITLRAPANVTGHSRELAEWTRKPVAEAAMLKAAEMMALAVIRLLSDRELMARVKKAFVKEGRG